MQNYYLFSHILSDKSSTQSEKKEYRPFSVQKQGLLMKRKVFY